MKKQNKDEDNAISRRETLTYLYPKAHLLDDASNALRARRGRLIKHDGTITHSVSEMEKKFERQRRRRTQKKEEQTCN